MSDRRRIGFPLLAKELTELANRRRTYVVRFLYAAGLFLGGLIAIYGTVGADGGSLELGLGEEIFRDLVQLQFWLTLIFLPATASGALTIEKERDSLALLLLTTMPPWSILIQKYLSRLTPMMSFLLLGFPLLAVAYSYGGVATGEMVASILLLLLFAAEVCAVALMCSAYCRTTTESLISTYVCLLCMSLVAPVWPPSLFAGIQSPNRVVGIYPIVAGGVVAVGMAAATSLLLARTFLQSRAFVPPRNVLLQAFQWLDRLFVRMNRVTGDIVLVNDTNSLPGDDPVAWRETAKKSLGTFRYLFRVCTVLELPILFVGASINISTVRTNSAMTALLFLLWGIAAAMVCVHASGVITAERSRQTLDVLLSTPLSGAELLRQKMAGVWRLIGVLMVPFASIYLFQLWFRGFHFGYLVGSVASAVILLRLMAWMSLHVGLRVPSPIKAVLISVGLVVGICIGPYLVAWPLGTLARPSPSQPLGWEPVVEAIEGLSPVAVISTLESRGVLGDRMSEVTFWLSILPLVAYGLLWWFLRRAALQGADRLLQRVDDELSLAESRATVPASSEEPTVAAAEPV